MFRFSFVVLCQLLLMSVANALPFNQDMVNGQLQSGAVMRGSPRGSVAVGSKERVVKFEGNIEKRTNFSVERGERLFRVNCTPCHGSYPEDRFIEGPVKSFIELKPVPNLHSAILKEKSNDHYLNVISKGLGLMPAYGERLSLQEHWDIVHYIRDVQSRISE